MPLSQGPDQLRGSATALWLRLDPRRAAIPVCSFRRAPRPPDWTPSRRPPGAPRLVPPLDLQTSLSRRV